MLLTMKRFLDGIINAAIEGKKLNIEVRPTYDNKGNVTATNWYFSGCEFDPNSEYEVSIKEFFCGYKMDGGSKPIRLYDATGTHPRFITDRTTAAQAHTAKNVRTGKSAFTRLIDIIQRAYPKIDDKVIESLLDNNLVKAKTGILYPLLVEIPQELQDEDEILDFFSSATFFAKKNRFWRKILILNGRRFFICNHIFHHSIAKFRMFMSELIGEDIEKDAEEIQAELKEAAKMESQEEAETFVASADDNDSLNTSISDDSEDLDKDLTDDLTDDLNEIDDIYDIDNSIEEAEFADEDNETDSTNDKENKPQLNMDDLLSQSFGF